MYCTWNVVQFIQAAVLLDCFVQLDSFSYGTRTTGDLPRTIFFETETVSMNFLVRFEGCFREGRSGASNDHTSDDGVNNKLS